VPDIVKRAKPDLVRSAPIWFALSFLVLAVGIYFLFAKGLNKGIDFTGGGLITYKLPAPISSISKQNEVLRDVRSTVSGLHIRNDVQLTGPTFGGKDQVLVRTQARGATDQQKHEDIMRQSDLILAELQRLYPGTAKVGTDMVGEVMSSELLYKALWAVILGNILIMIWIMIRYDLFFGQVSFKWSFSAVSALVHDVLVLIGMFALLQREVNSPFVAAVLTVVGFSVHDTIVIFDRIRENLKLRKGATFAETTNISLWETMPRSINTVLTVQLCLVALYLLGGPTIHDFVLAMIIGVTTGAYSSIFNASQILVLLKNREQRWRNAQTVAKQSVPRPTRLRQPELEPVAVSAGNAAKGEPVTVHEAKPAAAKKASRASTAKKRKRRF